ncbi:TPA: fibronectin-binding domain-containing protein [bacterium]|nr:fibronectin-binding domain-containing protein [bacterium]
MGFDGLFFRRATKLLESELVGGRLNRIHQISNQEYLFNIYKGETKAFLVSVHPNYAHFTISSDKWSDFLYPGHFVSLLRKHLEDGKIEEVTQIGFDRILEIKFQTKNDINEIVYKNLIIELTGKFTNLILINEDRRIIDALRRVPPLEQTIRTVQPGAMYYPLPLDEKKDPLIDKVDSTYSLSKQFHGISASLENELIYRMNNGENFHSIINEIKVSNKVYLFNNKGKKDYHFIPFLHVSEESKVYPWDEGLSVYYKEIINEQKRHLLTHEIEKTLKRDIKHNKQKLIKLEDEYRKATNYDKNRYYGDLLFTYAMDFDKGESNITILDQETNNEVTIPLNPLLSISENANKYYQKYQKGKTAVIMIKEQIDKTITEIDYLEHILLQIEDNDVEGINQIKEELIENKYLKAKLQTNKKKKKTKYLPDTYYSPTGIKISVGKNNLQNEYLTFTLAKQNEIFLHVKDYSGSHVVIHNDDFDEPTLRMAANLAAYYSKARFSSSVPVNYTYIKNVKKLKNAKPGKVTIKNYKTIYIDPSEPNKN